MTFHDLDLWCRSFLDIDAFASIDDSLNGIQVDRSEAPLSRLAFAVDASAESIRRAAESGASALFVHHGLFWGKAARVEGNLRRRLKLLLDADLGLYACHLPLDQHPEYGNNAGLAKALGLQELEPFGLYHGRKLGLKGSFPEAMRLESILARLGPAASRPACVIPAGPELIRSVAVVSGGGAFEALDALREGIDLYITGEASHSVYNDIVEGHLNFVALGHYLSETYGVRQVAEKLALEKGIETRFIDLPTGL